MLTKIVFFIAFCAGSAIVGMIGWGITVGSWWLSWLLVVWALFYVVAPFLEEPWLSREYGSEFDLYKANVPRFIGIPKC